ncbi:response regulator [Natronomonas sp.]|uniref:response regulator n=1 Tax=Natronomonas sp. TaxID=2184060 RepID=UPI0039757F6E
MSLPDLENETTDSSMAPIEVLLVDDNEQWAEFLASDLEQEADLEVTITLSANEALMTLRERDSIECVVADYIMPEIDGLQLLERLREEQPDLPFIFLTGQGSEDIASRAIKAGVSDYFRKDPSVDQSSLLANRITQAVGQYRLQRDLEESEERYRTITEQIWDGIVILRDDRVLFCNERFTELTGYDETNLDGASFVGTVIHPDDRNVVDETIRDVGQGNAQNDVFEARLVTSTEEVRDCEYTTRAIPFENDAATAVSIRDVTETKRRQRDLKRERELNRSVRAALVRSRTREELEREVTELLSDFGYELAWIGETTSDSIDPRIIVGGDRYVDELQLSTEGGINAEEPSIWTARTGDPQFIDDFENMFPTEWRELAIDCGYRSGAALPLRHDDVFYGILAVYHAEPNAIDERERELLPELSEALAFAIHHTEIKKALSSPTVVEAELELAEPTHYLTDLLSKSASDPAAAEITVEGTHRYSERLSMQYVTLSGIPLDRFLDAAETHSAIEETTIIDDGDPPRIQLSITELPPELTLTTHAAVVGPSSVTAERATLSLELPSRGSLSDVVEAIERKHGAVSTRSKIASERSDDRIELGSPINTAELTEKQAAALRAAYHHGYYERPRKSSAAEIADALGVAHSTYLQHLRTAQQKVFSSIYRTSADAQPDAAELS